MMATHAPAAPAIDRRKLRAVSGRHGSRALSKGVQKNTAAALDVSASRLSHLIKDDAAASCVAKTAHLVLVVADDDTARAVVSEIQGSYLRRPLLRAVTPVLVSRLAYLWHREHDQDGAEDKACALFMAGGATDPYVDALRDCAETQREIAELIDELEWRNVDVRALLLAVPKAVSR